MLSIHDMASYESLSIFNLAFSLLSIICICLMLTPLHDAVLFGGVTLDAVCVAVMVVVTVISGTEYFVKNRKLLNVKK